MNRIPTIAVKPQILPQEDHAAIENFCERRADHTWLTLTHYAWSDILIRDYVAWNLFMYHDTYSCVMVHEPGAWFSMLTHDSANYEGRCILRCYCYWDVWWCIMICVCLWTASPKSGFRPRKATKRKADMPETGYYLICINLPGKLKISARFSNVLLRLSFWYSMPRCLQYPAVSSRPRIYPPH